MAKVVASFLDLAASFPMAGPISHVLKGIFAVYQVNSWPMSQLHDVQWRAARVMCLPQAPSQCCGPYLCFSVCEVSWDFSLAAREGAYLFIQVLATGACGGAVCVCDVDSVCACLVVCSHCVYLRVRVHTCRQ